jgi:hypothetical protein
VIFWHDTLIEGLTGRTAVTIPKRVAVTEVSHWHSVNDASYLHILRDLGCDIVGVSDRSAQIVEDRAQRFGGIPFTDYRQMIEATKPEFVIALGRHCDMPEIFRFLVGAAVPFVMEKPWGTDAETVADLAHLADAKGAWVGVPFMSRYSFWAVTVKRMIEARIGKRVTRGRSGKHWKPTAAAILRRYRRANAPTPSAWYSTAIGRLGSDRVPNGWLFLQPVISHRALVPAEILSRRQFSECNNSKASTVTPPFSTGLCGNGKTQGGTTAGSGFNALIDEICTQRRYHKDRVLSILEISF